ncbi:MAG: EamA family transporter [Panacagrimonas sp.]
MSPKPVLHPGVVAGLTAAALFGVGTPAAKLLLGSVSPWTLAGVLYLGSGIGLGLYRLIARKRDGVRWPKGELRWLAGAIAAGGVVAPILLLLGLSRAPASSASLLLNAEGVLTAVLAWFVFKENFDRRIALGMLAIVSGAAILSWPSDADTAPLWPSLAIVGACLCWAIDNNLTRKISLMDSVSLAAMKGLVAGTANLSLSLAMGGAWPSVSITAAGMTVGFVAYGISLVLFITALRYLGTARAGAYFSVAPFFGAIVSVMMLGEPLTWPLAIAGALMALGVWLHLTEQHGHEHLHVAELHEHEHVHGDDPHHEHPHEGPVAPGTRHSHAHRHEPIRHSHEHVPDTHHRHTH